MLWGVSEMLNAAVTNLSDAGALEILPPGIFPLQPNSPSSHSPLGALRFPKCKYRNNA